MRCYCVNNTVTCIPQPVPAYHYIGFLCKTDQPFFVFLANRCALKTFIDQIGNRFKDRRCNPDEICAGSQCAKAGKPGSALVRSATNNQYLSPNPLVNFLCPYRKKREFSRTN